MAQTAIEACVRAGDLDDQTEVVLLAFACALEAERDALARLVLNWKATAERHYATKAYPDQMELGEGALDANFRREFGTDPYPPGHPLYKGDRTSMRAALQRAIDMSGGQLAFASAIGLSESHVWNWLARERVPAEHCPAIERVTERRVRCEELRPDVNWAELRELVAKQ